MVDWLVYRKPRIKGEPPVYTTVKAKLSCLYSPKSSLMYSNGKERAAGELSPSKISSFL
jgi:hypothetical protein